MCTCTMQPSAHVRRCLTSLELKGISTLTETGFGVSIHESIWFEYFLQPQNRYSRKVKPETYDVYIIIIELTSRWQTSDFFGRSLYDIATLLHLFLILADQWEHLGERLAALGSSAKDGTVGTCPSTLRLHARCNDSSHCCDLQLYN